VLRDKGTHLEEFNKIKDKVKVKEKFILERATKSQRGSRAITILFL